MYRYGRLLLNLNDKGGAESQPLRLPAWAITAQYYTFALNWV
jgi:hypothetical protein